MRVENNKIVGDVETVEIIGMLRGYALGLSAVGQDLGANIISLAADRLTDLMNSERKQCHGICDR